MFVKYDLNFTAINFDNIKYNFNSNNFIYLDPPYYPINDKSFVDYQKSGFTDNENNKLLNLCNKFNSNKIKFIHSNSCCHYNLTNYKNYNIQKILAKKKN